MFCCYDYDIYIMNDVLFNVAVVVVDIIFIITSSIWCCVSITCIDVDEYVTVAYLLVDCVDDVYICIPDHACVVSDIHDCRYNNVCCRYVVVVFVDIIMIDNVVNVVCIECDVSYVTNYIDVSRICVIQYCVGCCFVRVMLMIDHMCVLLMLLFVLMLLLLLFFDMMSMLLSTIDTPSSINVTS